MLNLPEGAILTRQKLKKLANFRRERIVAGDSLGDGALFRRSSKVEGLQWSPDHNLKPKPNLSPTPYPDPNPDPNPNLNPN